MTFDMHAQRAGKRIVATVGAGLMAGLFVCASALGEVEACSDITALQPSTDQSAALFSPDPLTPITDPVDHARAAFQSVGLTLELGVTTILQAATDSLGSRPPVLWSFSYDFAGQWQLLQDSPLGSGELGFHLEGGRPLGDRRTTDLASDIGSLLGINDDLDSEPVALTELWWSHHLFDDMLVLTLGKIDPTCFYDANRIANCETNQFLATPLVNNSAVAFPDNGLGINLTFEPDEWLYLSIGAHDARAVATQTGFNTLDENEFFYAAELGFTPTFGQSQGAYRVMAWSNETDDLHGRGLALSFDQELPGLPGVVPFFRYGYTEGEVADFDHLLSIGVGFEGLLGRTEDLLALGYVWADPTDASLRQESIAEVFYRIQLTHSLQLTPDLQCVINPAANPDRDMVLVMGLRLQMDF